VSKQSDFAYHTLSSAFASWKVTRRSFARTRPSGQPYVNGKGCGGSFSEKRSVRQHALKPSRFVVGIVAACMSATLLAQQQVPARRPLLTKDELHACLSQEAQLKRRLAAHEAIRAPLDQEKRALVDEQAAMRAERAKLDGGEFSAALAAYTDRNTALSERRARWEARVKTFNDAGRGGMAEDREALESERKELEKEFAALSAERKRVQDLQAVHQSGVQSYNAKAAALDARVEDWNKRNRANNEAGGSLESDRRAWIESCGNRRYRE
jgi:chromosome segregation ATPase